MSHYVLHIAIGTFLQVPSSHLPLACAICLPKPLKRHHPQEEEYTNSLRLLTESYQNIQNNFLQDLEQKKEEIAGELQKEREILDKVRETRAAAMEAQLREQEIKDKLSFYCLTIKDSELDDIKIACTKVRGVIE